MNEYLLKLYDWIGTKDSTFNSRISSEDFVSKMENDSDYGSKMYDWISTKDKSFEARLDKKEFYNKTFKKKRPFGDIFEESQDASISTEAQEGMESNTQQTEQNGSSDYSAITKAFEDRYNPNIETPVKGEKPTIENAPDWMKDPNLFAAREAGTVTDKDYRESGLEKGPVSTLGGSPTRQQQVEAFSRIENQKVKTDQELDFIAKQKGLGTDFAYEKFSSGDTFVKDNFDSEYLSKMNVNLTDFDGYLEKEGLKKDYLDREGRGFYENKDRALQHDEVLAKETDKLLMLNNYIKLQKKRDIDWQKLQDQRKTGVDPNNTEFKDSYKPSASNVNSTMLGNYIQKEMPQLTKKLKERDAKTKELYDQYKNGGVSWATFIATTAKSGWNGLTGRIEELNASAWGAMTVTGWDYYQNEADIRRSKISQDALLADDNLSYTFDTGKQVKVNGVNYLVNKDNQIYDVDKKINVTNVIDEKDYNNILKKSVIEGVTNSTFSGRGMTYETANVVGDMVIQIAGTKGFGSALTKTSALSGTVSKGTSLLSKGKNLLGKSIGYANKIPVNRSMASAIMAQSTMGLSSGYEKTLKAAKEAGINDEEARKLALIAGKETAILYALTAPISTQTKATEAIFGKIKKNTLDDVVSIYLKNGEAAVFRKFKESGKKILDYLGEGVKEGVQENIQQGGETLIIGDRTNKRAGQDIVKSNISYEDFINTTLLSFTAGMLMPGAGAALNSFNKKRRSLLGFDGIDRLKSLEELANNEDKVRSMLTSQEGQGVYTSKEVSDLLAEIRLFKTTIGKVPGSVNPKAMMEVMEDIDNISKLQAKKKSLDPAFHEDIDNEIRESRENIKTTIEAYNNLDTAIEAALKKEEVAKEEVAKEEVAENKAVTQAQKNLFGETHTDKRLPYGKAKISNITDADEKGVATATYTNPETGSVDAIISSKDKKNFVGYVRVYENGKPTNNFSAKMESTGGAFKNMITAADATLPNGARVIETTTISEGGLKSFNNSNLDVEVDADGNVVTNTTKYSDATKQSVEEKGESAYNAFKTDDKAKAEAEVEKIKKAYPGIEVKIKKQGTKRGKKTYTIDVDLPVLIKTNKDTTIKEVAKEEVAKEEVATEERLKDSQIPKSRTDFTVKDVDGKTTKVEVITNLDGSRKFIYKNENGWYRTETISKDNTLSNEAYVDLILEGEITDSSNVSLDKVISPKMAEKMSDRQREAIGIKT